MNGVRKVRRGSEGIFNVDGVRGMGELRTSDGATQAHVETLYFTEACTHFFEENMDRLHDLSDAPLYQEPRPTGRNRLIASAWE
jgi:hypothetical protein